MIVSRRRLLAAGGPAAWLPGLPAMFRAAWIAAAAASPGHARAAAPAGARMTRMFTGAVRSGAGPGEAAPLTYLMILPIEGHCTAVRLGFANYRADTAWAIQSASIYPSDSYGMAANMEGVGQGTPRAVAPTGGAPGSRVFFDHGGADSPELSTAGRVRSLAFAPLAANAANSAYPYTLAWSDFVPVSSVPRAQGGKQPLLFIYVTVASPDMVCPLFNARNWDLNKPRDRGRPITLAVAVTGRADFADRPAETAFKATAFTPVLAVQYVSRVRGATILTTGDSLVTTPTDDSFSNAIVRAAMDLSTPEFPIEVADLAWGGTAWKVYGAMLHNNIDAIAPSVVALQPLSRNDGSTPAAVQGLFTKSMEAADVARARFGSAAMWFSPGCEPSYDGTTAGDLTEQAAMTDLRARMANSFARDHIPLIDGPGIIGRPGMEWLYSSANAVVDAPAVPGTGTILIRDDSKVARARAGDFVWSTTRPRAFSADARITAATPTTVTLSHGALLEGLDRGERFVVGPASLRGKGGFTDDNTHPNDAGVEATVPAARVAVSQAIGLRFPDAIALRPG